MAPNTKLSEQLSIYAILFVASDAQQLRMQLVPAGDVPSALVFAGNILTEQGLGDATILGAVSQAEVDALSAQMATARAALPLLDQVPSR